MVYPENFGYDVDIQGNLAVVGALQDSRRGQYAGTAFLYDWTTGQPLAELVPHDVNAGDEFATTVAFGSEKVYAGAS